jgi:hypothetical protein
MYNLIAINWRALIIILTDGTYAVASIRNISAQNSDNFTLI